MEEPVSLPWRKSSYSGNGGGDCVEVAAWRKSTFSGNGGGSCVEAGQASDAVLVRDTTDRDGGTLSFAPGTWGTFVTSLR
jgi:hypothetical protein